MNHAEKVREALVLYAERLEARIQELEALLAEYEREGPPPSNVQLREAVSRIQTLEAALMRIRESSFAGSHTCNIARDALAEDEA
jgi:HPt (histidine-containing phosphotransfer) domain-containing protein